MSVVEKAGNSLDIGVQFGRYVTRSDRSDAQMLAFVEALVDAPCETVADALAVVAWAEVLMLEVAKMLQDGNGTPELAEVAATAVLLCRKAVGALETTSGLAVEAFSGTFSRPN